MLQVAPLFSAVCCQGCYIKGRKERGKYMYLLYSQKQRRYSLSFPLCRVLYKDEKQLASSPGPFPAFQCCTLKSTQRATLKAGNGPGDEARKKKHHARTYIPSVSFHFCLVSAAAWMASLSYSRRPLLMADSLGCCTVNTCNLTKATSI